MQEWIRDANHTLALTEQNGDTRAKSGLPMRNDTSHTYVIDRYYWPSLSPPRSGAVSASWIAVVHWPIGLRLSRMGTSTEMEMRSRECREIERRISLLEY